ncbi:MFS transporter [Nocardioides euryhalodurans]|uniref:MFS transporter n=1 Tax=Nocardioides euryhalodurans TaxID=2518370 RepID=A0A4P7GRP1_9ACTN|nr:MFS transporter [Nocardioides euryhalodurans]
MTAVLCLTQVTGWGVLFYAFPVLAPTIAEDTGWATSAVIAAFTVAQLVSAAVGIWVGRRIDRHGPRAVMTTGSLLATVAVLLVASSSSLPWFVAAWVLAGTAMSAVLYPPAFAAVTRWHDAHDRLRALTVLTIAGGLASTVFAPLTASLLGELGWRTTYVVLAVVLAALTVPAHLWGLRGPWPAAPAGRDESGTVPREVVTSRAFVALAVAFTLTALSAFAVIVNLVPLLAERGIGLATAGLVLGLGGLGQVAGRLGFGLLRSRLGGRGTTVLVLALLAATTALLGVVDSLALVVVAGLLAGIGRGIFTLLQATAVTERWGGRHYGHLNGVLTAPATVAIALAPWVGASLAGLLGSYSAAFLVLAAVNGLAAVVCLASYPRRDPVGTG